MKVDDLAPRGEPFAHLDLRTRIVALAEALAESAWLWRPRPFATATPPWAEREPGLVAFCLGLDDATLFRLEEGAALPTTAPAVLCQWRDRLAALTAVPSSIVGEREGAIQNPPQSGPLRDWRWMIPGRKLRQIECFIDALRAAGDTGSNPTHAATHILDWCGGKGHLGRSLGHALGLPVAVLEYEPTYADECSALARRIDLPIVFENLDALGPEAAALASRLPASTLAVGLHACGALGERLLALSATHRWPTVVHSPCCLHKVPGLKTGRYQPLSSTVASAIATTDLVLDHSALRLATSDETVARPALRQSRRKENAWRLAIDLLLQEAAGHDHYTPLGTLPADLLRGDFATFAREAAALRGLSLPVGFSPELALERGFERANRARRFGLVRSFFRRAIELFVALDRAAFLAENGYRVTVTTFADRSDTPRNLMVAGWLDGPSSSRTETTSSGEP